MTLLKEIVNGKPVRYSVRRWYILSVKLVTLILLSEDEELIEEAKKYITECRTESVLETVEKVADKARKMREKQGLEI